MKLVKLSAIAIILLCGLSISSVHASRYLTFINRGIPGSYSDWYTESIITEKKQILKPYLNNKGSVKVRAEVYGKGIDNNFGWSGYTVVSNGWNKIGNYNNASSNPMQYGIFSSNDNKIRLKSNSIFGTSFNGDWITDREFYEML